MGSLFLVGFIALAVAYLYRETTKDDIRLRVFGRAGDLIRRSIVAYDISQNDHDVGTIALNAERLHSYISTLTHKDNDQLLRLEAEISKAWAQLEARLFEIGIKEAVDLKAVEYGRAVARRALGKNESEKENPHLYVRTESDIIMQFKLPHEEFRRQYESYKFSLSLDGVLSNWNDEINDMARLNSFLTDKEIEVSSHDFHQAVLNRIIVRNSFGKSLKGHDE